MRRGRTRREELCVCEIKVAERLKLKLSEKAVGDGAEGRNQLYRIMKLARKNKRTCDVHAQDSDAR